MILWNTLSVLTVLLAGCWPAGRKIDEAKVQQIKTCATTEQQMLEWFGEPQRRGIQDGYATLSWYFVQNDIGGTAQQYLVAKVNGEKRVVDFVWNPPTQSPVLKDGCSAPGTPGPAGS